MKNKPEKVPPFAYRIRDPHLDVIYCVFSDEPIKTNAEVWSRVSRFLGSRKRRMPKNWRNLPKAVNLLVRPDRKVIPFDLPTQKQLDQEQKIQIQKKKQIEKFREKKGWKQ